MEAADWLAEHWTRLQEYALKVARDPTNAQDLLHDTAERVLSGHVKLDPDKAPFRYFYLALLFTKQNQHVLEWEERDLAAIPVVMEDACESDWLREALATMPPTHRETVEWLLTGETIRRVAQRMGCSKTRVVQRMEEVRHRLRKMAQAQPGDEAGDASGCARAGR